MLKSEYYSISAAPGSGVCREARGGACVRHAEEVSGQGKSLKIVDRQTSGTCPEANSGASQTGQCKNGKCDVWIGGGDFCSQCSQTTDYLINGKYTNTNTDSACGNTPDSGVCTSCKSGYFLHRGGCYQIGTEPGNLVCKDTAASSTQGTCDACRPGYFRNPVAGLDKTKESCIACNETTAVDSNTGVANCAECTAPAASGSSGSNQKAKCTACADGYFISSDGPACTACNDGTNGVADCTACVPREDDPAKAKCTACSGSKKPSLDGLHCYACAVDNCASCNSGGACQKCASGYILDGAACTQQTCSTPDCKTCTNPKTASEICTACVSNYYLTPTSQCIADCAALSGYYGATENEKKVCKRCEVANCEACNAQGQCQTCRNGFYLDTKECKACDSSCKSCSGATNADCTACPAGKALKYGSDGTKGTCGNGCATGTGSGACKTCGLTVEGTKYCSECATPTEYPQNGVCSSTTARTAATCKTNSVSSGACTSCSDGFFLMEGGCYETTRYPGKSVCTEAASTGGTCQTAAPGYKLDNGNLVTCPEGCFACTSSTACGTCADGYVLVGTACLKCDASCLTCETDASTCKECASGYYKTASAAGPCTSCESNNGGIAGVRGCASCAAPSTGTGPVLCYLVRDGAAGPLSSRPRGYVCSDCSCHRYHRPPAGCVTWWQSAPEAVSRTP